jgi:hypothetical protein
MVNLTSVEPVLMAPMVGMSRPDRGRPIDLLRRNHRRQLVRQGHFAKADHEICLPQATRAPSIGRPDCKDHLLHTAIPHPSELTSERLGRKLSSPAVGQDEKDCRSGTPSFDPAPKTVFTANLFQSRRHNPCRTYEILRRQLLGRLSRPPWLGPQNYEGHLHLPDGSF